MVESAVAKHHSRIDVVFGKAIFAGLFLSFGGLLSQILSAGSPGLTASNPGMVKILSGFVFPVGLVMIVLMGADLLTSNMMTFPMAILKRRIPLWSLPLNWFVVFFGNLVGSLFFAAILTKFTDLVDADPYKTAIQAAAVKKALTPNFLQIFLRGIGCNFLVCTAIWMGATGREVISKIFGIWIPIWIFVACSYDHVVANMFLLPLGILLKAPGLTAATYIKKSLFAALFGNIVGALILAVPFTFWFLKDYGADGLMSTEAGEGNGADRMPNTMGGGVGMGNRASPNSSLTGEKRV